jgi:DNA-binding response OmpR family regulator
VEGVGMDLMVQGIDGREVLRRIRCELALCNLPVIVLSGDVLDARSSELLELGATATIAKPVDFDELLAKVARFADIQNGAIAQIRP